MSHTRCIIESELFNKEDLAQFQAIQKHFNWDEPTTRAKIGTWMTLKDTDELPTVEDMKTYEKTYGKKITVKNTEYTASTESNDIRYNKDAKELFDLLSYIAKTLKYTQKYTSVIDSQVHEVISKLHGKFYLTKSDPVRAKQELEKYRISQLLPEKLFNYDKRTGEVTINKQVLIDTIERNSKNANFGDLFGSQEEAQAVKTVLDFLSAKAGLKYETISFEEAKKLNKNVDDSTNAFVHNGICYFIEGRKLNVDIASEEMLHPFIAALRNQNKELFKNLLKESKAAFPKLRLEIAESYKGRPLEERQEELVTQALSRAFRTELENHPKRRQITELLNHFVQWIKETLRIGEKKYILTDEISADTTLTDLVKILNTELKLVYNSSYKNITRENRVEAQQTSVQEQPVNTYQEKVLPNATLEQQMKQTLTPQKIQNRANLITRLFRDVVTDLENNLPEIEQLSTSSDTRKYIITTRYGSGNILNRVKEEIAKTFANLDWVTDYVHEMVDESQWDSPKCQEKINYIYNQGQLTLKYFEPLCEAANSTIKQLEGVSILTSDGEVVDLSEDELITDEELQTKHEEGWFYNPHEQSVESTLQSETVNVLSNIYETDADGLYTRFDDLEQPIPLDFKMVLATTNAIVGSCTIDTQMIPKLKQMSAKYPWMTQILDMLMGVDTESSSVYEGLSDEDIRLKALSLQSIFWHDLHKIHVNIAEQVRTDEDEEGNKTKNAQNIKCRIVNEREGADALLKQFEDNCYSAKTIFNNNHKPYKTVYNGDSTFNKKNYQSIYELVYNQNNHTQSSLFRSIPSFSVTEEEIDIIDKALKSFGANVPIESIKKLFDTSQGITPEQQEKVKKLSDVILKGFYATNQSSNQPLQDVISEMTPNIYDAFRSNYIIVSEIFGDESAGYEESNGRVNVDGENKLLFSRIFPNLIGTIVNKLKNVDQISENNYKARLQRDYGHNWWFAPKTDANGNGVFRRGLLKDLFENPSTRVGLRLKTLKASNEKSQAQEMDAQAYETRINEFENTNETIDGINYRDYSVPTFSDKGESYYMRMRYFNIKNDNERHELLVRLTDVLRQEIDRINVVEERARVNAEAIKKGLIPTIKPIACWDITFDKDGNRKEDRKNGSYFHFFSAINGAEEAGNAAKNAFLEKFNSLSNNPTEQQKFLEQIVEDVLASEFDYFVQQYNDAQVNALPNSKHNENSKDAQKSRKPLIEAIEKALTWLPLNERQKTIIDSIVEIFKNNTLTENRLRALTNAVSNIFMEASPDKQWAEQAKAYLDTVQFDTTNLDKLKDYFWNNFYATSQIINITMRDPAFLGTPDKFQKRYAMFYSPVATCYTVEYDLAKYKETGELVALDPNNKNSLVKTTEYSLILKDDIIDEAFSFDNIKAAVEKKVIDGYLTKDQADEILCNYSALYAKSIGKENWEDYKIVRSDAQCYRTLPSWQKCLNMIGKGYNKKMQQSINRLTDPDKYGQWSYEDYHNVWEIFKPFVASYNQTESGITSQDNPQFNEQFANIEMPVMHKNAEFLLLSMYSQLSGVMKDNWRLKAINEFMVKHGIDKAQFESAVKVGIQGPIDLSKCTTPEEITATLEGTTGLHNDMQANEGNQQVVHAIPFRDWGISTAMPEHLLEHEESSEGTQLMKIVMEGVAKHPNKIVKINGIEKTYKQWLEFYQAIEVQNLKESFEEVGLIFNSDEELAKYLRKQIQTQNKYSKDLLNHLEVEGGVFKYPIKDPLLKSQFDALCNSLIRNKVTKRMMRMGALPQVASYGFDDLQLRFNDRYGNLILTEKEFNEQIAKKSVVKIKAGENTLEFTTWEDYKKYSKDNCTSIAYMEVLIPPFDTTLMKKLNDVCIYKEDVYENSKLVHHSGEFNQELFDKIFNKKLLDSLGNRVPTETKHSMIPMRVVGFLPSQNSSCVVCPAEWIAMSDSDNDGDKLYSYFYHSKVVWDTTQMKKDWADHYGWKYMPKSQRDAAVEHRADKTSTITSDFKSENYKKSEELDMMWDAMLAGKSVDAGLDEFYKQAQNNVARYLSIEPVKFKREKLERLEGESDINYQQRVDLESIKSNNHEARNNMLLDLMRSILQTDDNTAQCLIPGGFPIVKKVSSRMKKLKGIKDNACSIGNAALRVTQQVNNMAGRNLIGFYANHRSFRPLLEQANCTLHPDYHIVIDGNQSLVGDWSLSSEKNALGEFISDNISNFSGASVDNAKDPRLKHLAQNEVTASISMFMLHLGYSIDDVAVFMNQPSIEECVREYMLNNKMGFLEDIVKSKIAVLEAVLEDAEVTEAADVIANLPKEMLDNAITRNAQHILPDNNDKALQLQVLKTFAKILPASRAIQDMINVTKADTQVGALTASNSENKAKLQKITRLTEQVTKDSYPIQGAAALIPTINTESEIKDAVIPHIAAFRYYGIECLRPFMKDKSFTFDKLVDTVHAVAVGLTDRLSLDSETIEALTNATVSYIFSSVEAFDNTSKKAIMTYVPRVLSEIKRKNLIPDNQLIKNLVPNVLGNKYSKGVPFIKMSKLNRKNVRDTEMYNTAWESLILNGDKAVKLDSGEITYREVSDLLLMYCFAANGLNIGGNSFIQYFPKSQISTIEGYLTQLSKDMPVSDKIAMNIVEQYIANNPDDYHFVHKIGGKEISPLLETLKVMPNTIIVENTEKHKELWETIYSQENKRNIPAAYPFISFRDKAGHRYLYKGDNTTTGVVKYRRMQVLGNNSGKYLEEYQQGKNIIFNDNNSIKSIVNANNNVIRSAEIQNAIDLQNQEATKEGRTLTAEEYRKTIEQLVGSNVEMNINMNSYTPESKDLTGVEFCVTL